MASCDRREFLSSVAAGVAASAVAGGATRLDAVSAAATAPAPAEGLAPLAFTPLPLGAIRPAGWLLRQLRIQANGLTGHLDEFWPDVGESQWFGGKAEGWERAPYWLDGAIPLAWLLDDEALKSRITRYVDFIVTHQRADGWYGPYPEDAVAKRYDMWAILLANKVLVQYHEAAGDARALDAVVKSLKAIAAGLDRTPLYGWGRFRWYEGLVSVYYAYERTREAWLLDLARKLRDQGVDFEVLYRTGDI
ncbi:MAG: beta-L-arabinofuranosidase domain-containing protein, partial [Rhodospirillaceae bacterium]